MAQHLTPLSRSRGYSLIEVLVSLTILLTGIVAVAAYFPMALRANQRSTNQSIAAFLAQAKAEEIRRDNDTGGSLVREISELTAPTPPIIFTTSPFFTYSFSGVSAIDPVDDPDDVRDDHGVARVIVQDAPSFRSDQEILFELRFDD
jgi:prepilin-type N-terminal cleavage/methylation domain-containing protein